MKKLLKKDFLLFLKIGGPLLCLVVSFITPIICCVIYSDFDTSLVKPLLSTSLVFMSPMAISIIISLLLTSSFAIEIKDRTIIYLLANGFRQQDVWMSKLIAAFVCSYITLCVSNLIFEVAVYIQWGIWMDFSIESILLMMIIFPFISLVFSGVLWFVMWVTKSLGSMIAGIFPTGLYMFSMIFCQKLVEKNIDINWYFVIAVLFVTFVILFFLGVGVNKVSKEYWVNIHR